MKDFNPFLDMNLLSVIFYLSLAWILGRAILIGWHTRSIVGFISNLFLGIRKAGCFILASGPFLILILIFGIGLDSYHKKVNEPPPPPPTFIDTSTINDIEMYHAPEPDDSWKPDVWNTPTN